MALTRAQIFFANHAYQGPIPGTSDDFDPLSAFSWKAAFYAGDPLWTPPADGDPVAAWKNGGTTRTEGAYLSTAAGLTLPGTAGNYASVPDEAALDITGDIDIRVKVALDDWTPAARSAFVSHTNGAITEGFSLEIETSGTPRLWWYDGATKSATATSATGVSDGSVKWLRATLDVDNGASGYDVKFYLSDDGESWSQLGSTVTGGATTSITASGDALGFGGRTSSGQLLAGDIHRVQVYDGIAGTKVLDVDFQRADTNKFTCTSGQTVTVFNSLDAVQFTGTKQPAYRASVAALNGKPAVQGDGVDDFLQTAAWSSALTQPSSVVVVGSVSAEDNLTDGITSTNRHLVKEILGTDWRIFAGTSVDGGTSDTDPHLFAAVFNGASSTLDVDGVEVVSGNAGAQTLTGLTIGSNYNGTAAWNSGHIAFVGAIAGDIEADANWPAFVAWVESHYGLVIA